jgi:hypothetical protein
MPRRSSFVSDCYTHVHEVARFVLRAARWNGITVIECNEIEALGTA